MANLETDSPVVWPKWCYNNRPKNEDGTAPDTTGVKTLLPNKARRRKIMRNNGSAANVKRERCSPDTETGTGSSQTLSPYSPISGSFRASTPSTRETPTDSCFSTIGQYSPVNYKVPENKSTSKGIEMSRNCSDFMRSLAAKYNNSNPNDYQLQETNSFMSLLDSRTSCKDLNPGNGSLQPTPFPLFNFPLTTFTSHMLAASKHYEMVPAVGETGKKERKEYSAIPLLPLCELAPDDHLRQALPPSLLSSTAIDMSSTQALLNIVRSATARRSPCIHPYSSDPITRTGFASLKRPAETTAITSHIPLDLSASMAKRPYLESQVESLGHGRVCQRSSPRSPAVGSKNTADKQLLLAICRKSPSSNLPSDTNVHAGEKIVTQSKMPVLQIPKNCHLNCAAHSNSTSGAEVREWSISHVVDFVRSIDICCEYAQAFEDQSIDGSTLPLLTEEHLIASMNMKLGPALKLRSVLAKKIGHCAACLHCVHCHAEPGVDPSPASQNHQNFAKKK